MMDISRSSMGLDKVATAAVFAGGLLLCMTVTWSFSGQVNQGMVAMLLAGLLIAIGLIAPIKAMVITFVYLAIMGDLRRLFVYQTGMLIENDPLLVVGPAVAIGLIMTPFARGQVDFNKGLSRLVFCLGLIMLLEVFNPYQGGLIVGLAGGMFYIIPLVWFYLGQKYGTEELLGMIFFKVILPVAVVAALFGIWQTFMEFPAYQLYWIDLIKQKFPLTIGDRVRPFAFFVSPAEFAHYCMVLLVIAVTPLLCGKMRPIVLMAALGMAGIVLQGGRGQIVTGVGGIVVMFAALGRTRMAVMGRLGMATLVAVGVVVLGLLSVSGSDVNEKIAPLLQRQQQGLLNPLNQEDSTLIGHIQIAATGIIRAVKYPFGQGLGATTIAGRYSEDDDAATGTTEIDFTNMFASLGFPGGILYLIILGKTFQMTFRLVQYRRSPTTLAILGLLAAQFTQWLNGGQYALASITWFAIGSMVKQTGEMEQELAPAPL
jgi:hypothetical protein